MNILFFNWIATAPQMGGVERVTASICRGLMDIYAHKTYSLYYYTPKTAIDFFPHDGEAKLRPDFSPEEVARYLDEWDIDVVVNQQQPEHFETFSKAIKLAKKQGIRHFYFHHNTPGRLMNLTFSQTLREWKKHSLKDPKGWAKLAVKTLGYPIVSRMMNRKTLRDNGRMYKRIYDLCDKFVVLSKHFYPELLDISEISDTRKLDAVPNMTSFETFADPSDLAKKERRVLMVGRLMDFPKNFLMAIKIWKSICDDPRADGWEFDIVGEGPDREFYQEYVKQHKIPRINFTGRQRSEPYYERSSIFLMVSSREGWAMTLIESMQKGVVPMAFSTFGSLQDTIEGGRNGILVKPYDKRAYGEELLKLMADSERRNMMAREGLEMARRYTPERVLERWQALLKG